MIKWEGRKTLVRKVVRRASRSGEVVGVNVGSGPVDLGQKGLFLMRENLLEVEKATMFSTVWSGCEAAGLGL